MHVYSVIKHSSENNINSLSNENAFSSFSLNYPNIEHIEHNIFFTWEYFTIHILISVFCRYYNDVRADFGKIQNHEKHLV